MMNATPRQSGFTLTEVLIAMAIFLLGVIFVAALFPAAAVMQKETVTEIRVDQAAHSISAMLSARRYFNNELMLRTQSALGLIENDDGDPDVSGRVHRFISDISESVDNPMLGNWGLQDRTYPLSVSPQMAELVWVPLIMDTDPSSSNKSWRIYAFILKRQQRATYQSANGTFVSANEHDAALGMPQVGRIDVLQIGEVEIDGEVREAFRINNGNQNNLELKPGNWFLDSNGTIYRVYQATTQWVQVDGFIDQSNPITHLWYAPPGSTGASPCWRIIMQKVETQ